MPRKDFALYTLFSINAAPPLRANVVSHDLVWYLLIQ